MKKRHNNSKPQALAVLKRGFNDVAKNSNSTKNRETKD
jgi:hypothetical protein